MKKDIYKEFRGINEFVDFLDKNHEFSRWTLYASTYDPSWYGTENYEEAKEKVLRGDDILAKELRGCDKLDIHIPTTGTRKRMMTGVVGFMPHVPNYLAGVPNNMIFVKEKPVKNKVIKVMYGCNTLCDVSAEEIRMVSARVMSSIMALERKGYRVELWSVNCAELCHRKVSKYAGFSVKIKDAGQHIDVLKMAFPFLSASWNRRFAFRFREEYANWDSMGSSVYGDELRSYLQRCNVKYDVALSFYDAQNIRTREELEELFVKSANKIK